MWNCLLGHGLKRSLWINRKSRALYSGPGFLSSATWPSLPKKHYNGLINQSNGKTQVFFKRWIAKINCLLIWKAPIKTCFHVLAVWLAILGVDGFHLPTVFTLTLITTWPISLFMNKLYSRVILTSKGDFNFLGILVFSS